MLQRLTKTFSFRWRRFFIFSCLILFVFNVAFIYYRVDYGGVKAQKQIEKSSDLHLSTDVTYPDESSKIECNSSSDLIHKVLNRAKSDQCRTKIETLGCILQSKSHRLHPTVLPRQCPLSNPTGEGYWLGCFKDNPANRIFKAAMYSLKETNSPDRCIAHCLRVGQEVAGLEYQTECYCGSKSNLQNIEQLEESKCDEYDCPGNPAETCGGYAAIGVYKTGLGTITNVPISYVKPGTKFPADKQVKIAFLLQLNGRAVRQVKRMLKLIYRPEHFYYVHVDERQDFMYREMLKLEKIIPKNFKVKRTRFSTIWGGASLLDMMLDSAKDLLDLADESSSRYRFEYLVNLSEADMPLMSVEELQLILTKYRGVNFLKNHGNSTARFIKKQGLDKIFFECEGRMWRLGDRRLPDGIRIDGGSDWFLLHRTFLEYAVRSEDSLVKGLKKMYRYALLPAESFFHTLAANSVFCIKTTNANLKLTNWRRKQGCKCQYKHIVDWCGCSPSVFLHEDISRLGRPTVEVKMQYLARKFEAIIDQQVIAAVEIGLLIDRSTDRSKIPSFSSYWQNEFDAQDLSAKQDFKIVLLNSLTRRACESFFCTNLCRPTRVSSMNVYKSQDKFAGLTVEFDTQCAGNLSFTSEIFVKMHKNFTIFTESHHLATNLVSLEVGTDFDLKEEIFRNYAGVFTETSVPVLRHQWSGEMVKPAGGPAMVNVVWIDPNGRETSLQPTKLDSPTGVEHNNLNISQLTVGIWSVHLKIVGKTIAETKFLILPSIIESIYPSDNRLTDQTIDELVAKFYALENICILESPSVMKIDEFSKSVRCENDKTEILFEFCRSASEWSSFYPDPKSDIQGVHPDLGILVP